MSAPDSEAVRKLFAGACEFVAGAADIDAIPPASLPEVAFVGRSNAGKSSLINALTGRNALARVSQNPGRTRQINFFDLGGVVMLADLPGYGFARVSKAEGERWRELIFSYLRGRASLKRVALLIDARRGLMESDREVMTLMDRAAVSYLLVLTKADTLKAQEAEHVAAGVLAESRAHPAAYPDVIVTSAEKGLGLDLLRMHIADLSMAPPPS